MTVSALAQGWADAARSGLSRAGRNAAGRVLVAGSDLLGLQGILPDRVTYSAMEPRRADLTAGEALIAGIYALEGGTETAAAGMAPWRLLGPNETWRNGLHGFTWLRHVTAYQALHPDGRPSRNHAWWLVNTWMHECGAWHPVAWRPEVTARRLMTWLTHAPAILEGSDLIWRSAFLRSVSRQAHHLYLTAPWAPEGEPRLTAAIGLALSGLCVPHGEARVERGLALTLEALGRQILPDGGHVSRSPAVLADVFLDLARLDRALAERRGTRPEALQHALDRMAPMLRLFVHGDGVTAAFHGARRIGGEELTDLLAFDPIGGQALQRATATGYHRIARGKTLAILDTAPPPGGAQAALAHAGCLAFELSSGDQRIIVNCGAGQTHGPDWHQALRATAAHSTITVGERSCAQFLNPARGDGRLVSGPSRVDASRADQDEGTLIDATHDGYAPAFGVVHRRRFYVSASGRDVRGEDTVMRLRDRSTRARGSAPLPVTARFHLHPDVTPQRSGDGDGLHLALGDGSLWRFQVSGGQLGIEESAYLDETDTLTAARQLVVSGTLAGDRIVFKWALQAMAPIPPVDTPRRPEQTPPHAPGAPSPDLAAPSSGSGFSLEPSEPAPDHPSALESEPESRAEAPQTRHDRPLTRSTLANPPAGDSVPGNRDPSHPDRSGGGGALPQGEPDRSE